jgi:uncharacterized protein
MKYLLLLAIVVVVLFAAKLGRQLKAVGKASAAEKPAAARGEKEPLLACAHCGVHMPLGESLPGRGGVFCDETHRSAFERAHPL